MAELHFGEEWLTYDQIALIPTQASTLEHRIEADAITWLGPAELLLPIIAAPMPDVSNGEMAETLIGLGSLGWIHRFQSDEEKWKQASKYSYPHGDIVDKGTGIAIGLKYSREAVEELYNSGARIFCIDTANGISVMVERVIKTLKDKYPDIFIVAGNVASWQAFTILETWGADAIRVGIASGSVCETRTETGVYSPMVTAIDNCAHTYYRNHNSNYKRTALLIADGGIRTPSDMIKALALGADLVMMGGALAGTAESPGRVIVVDGKKFKVLRGAASFGVQKEAGTEDINYVEGAETLVPYVGSVEKVINRYAAGLRSAMSYFNARDLTEFRKNVKIVRCQ